jgi:hypothetical protein
MQRPVRTPEQTLIAYYRAFDDRDSVTASNMEAGGQTITGRVTWSFRQQKYAQGTHRLIDPLVEYSPDSIQCDIHYDLQLIDRASGKVAETKYNLEQYMQIIEGEWRLTGGADDALADPKNASNLKLLQEQFSKIGEGHRTDSTQK